MTENVMIGTRIAIAMAVAKPGRMGCNSGCVARTGDDGDAIDDETCDETSEDDTVDDGAWDVRRNEGGARFSEYIETRSSVGSRKCVSASAMGCSVCRYARYCSISSASG